MRKSARITVLVFLFAGLAASCGPDPSEDDGESTDTWTVDDTGQQDTSDEEPQDTGPVDSGLEDTGVDTGVDTGSDTGVDSGMDTAGDTGGDTTTPVDAYPKNFGAGSFIDAFYIDKQNPGSPRCCFDIDGDGQPDNATADMIAELPRISVSDVNSEINSGIQAGDFIYLFEYRMWSTSNWENDNSITMYGHPGEEAGTDQYNILPKSYDQNGDPKSYFNSASVSSRDLQASGGKLEIPLTLGQGIAITMKIREPVLEAKVDSSASVGSGGKVPLNNGQLGGSIKKANFYGAINDACNCNSGKRIERQSSSSETWSCNSSTSCTCTPQLLENSLVCNSIQSSVSSNADIDSDSDGTNDSLTFGANFTAAGAEIVGIASP